MYLIENVYRLKTLINNFDEFTFLLKISDVILTHKMRKIHFVFISKCLKQDK